MVYNGRIDKIMVLYGNVDKMRQFISVISSKTMYFYNFIEIKDIIVLCNSRKLFQNYMIISISLYYN